ncbi:hypothetical protein CRU96_05630 [Malaciobacter halophilus]|nr:hypothetical protein [Malaciobacter halophilus]RYA23887.1 hypothetical protein CRU96_05630 [Malaciobacter halophilus]
MKHDELTEKQKQWLFDGEKLELLERLKIEQNKYLEIIKELHSLLPSYHHTNHKHSNENTYSQIDSLLSNLDDTIRTCKKIDDEIENLHNRGI